MSQPYVVFGANGRTGSAAALALLDAGAPVRVVLRDRAQADAWRRRGATIAFADVTDLATTLAALEGAAGAYLLGPQEYGRDDLFERADRIAAVYAEAVRRTGVGKVVALSSIGADRDSATGWIAMNRQLEQHLGTLDQSVAFIRAAYFMENWAPMIATAVQRGRLASFLAPSDRLLPMVAAADVGRTAATLLLTNWTGKRIVDLGGPRSYSPTNVAKCLSDRLDRPVAVDVLSESQWPEALRTAGFSAAGLRGFIEMTRSLNSGHIAFHGRGETWSGTISLPDAVAAISPQ